MAPPNREDVREFLTSRRAKVRPEQVGLAPGPNRRVPGLRRTEVALLAGVSVEYYTRLERGDLGGVSDQVLWAIADALLLDEAEREHLVHLARAAGPAESRRRTRRGSRPPQLRPSLQNTLDAIVGGPALVRNGRMDIVGANLLARALYCDAYAAQPPPVNIARFAFLARAQAEHFYPDWDVAADQIVAILRAEAGRDPHDPDLQDLVGQLSTVSEDFRVRWGAHDVRRHDTGQKHFRHRIAGELHLQFESSDLPADPGWKLQIYTAEPGSATSDALRLLATWAATQEQEQLASASGARPPQQHQPERNVL